MSSSIHYEPLRTYGEAITFVSAGDINLISSAKDSRTFVNSESIHLGAGNSAVHILGEEDDKAIFINTAQGGQIVINASTGGGDYSLVRLNKDLSLIHI